MRKLVGRDAVEPLTRTDTGVGNAVMAQSRRKVGSLRLDGVSPYQEWPSAFGIAPRWTNRAYPRYLYSQAHQPIVALTVQPWPYKTTKANSKQLNAG